MSNATQIITLPTKGVISTVTDVVSGTTVACATTAVGVGLWIYEKTITNPLRILYFVGPVWKNAPPDEICHSLTGVPSAWWVENLDRQQACADLLERKFSSFDASVMVTVYFTFLTFVVLQLLCTCCCIRPLARAIRRP
jgi:hypothetical protein